MHCPVSGETFEYMDTINSKVTQFRISVGENRLAMPHKPSQLCGQT